HILDRHPDPATRHALIQDYFREAFGVAIVRGVSQFGDIPETDLRCAFLNQDLLHEMTVTFAGWSSEVPDDSWLKGLTATDWPTRLRQAEAAARTELPAGWEKLSPDERDVVLRLIAGLNGRNESCRIL